MRLSIVAGLLLVTTLPVGAVQAFPANVDRAALTGTLTKDGTDYVVDGTELDLGPTWYISDTTAPADYDDDGAAETISAEFDGLVGTTVSIGGKGRAAEPLDDAGALRRAAGHFLDSLRDSEFRLPRVTGDDFDVYVVNDLPYRDVGVPPPWAGAPDFVEERRTGAPENDR